MLFMYIVAGMLFEFIKWHLLISLIITLIHEISIRFLAKKIFENGWISQNEIDEAFEKKTAQRDLDYYLMLFTPLINILCLADVYYQAIVKKEDDIFAER